MRLDSSIAPDTGKITPGSEAGIRGNSSIYDAKQLTGKNTKGDLLIPETISIDFKRWFLLRPEYAGLRRTSINLGEIDL